MNLYIDINDFNKKGGGGPYLSYGAPSQAHTKYEVNKSKLKLSMLSHSSSTLHNILIQLFV